MKAKTIRKNANAARVQAVGVVIVFVLALVLPLKGYLGFAQESVLEMPKSAETLVEISSSSPSDETITENNVSTVDDGAAVPFPDFDKEEIYRQNKTSRFFSRIKNEIELSESNLLFVNNQIRDANSKIEDASERITTLNEQLAILDEQISVSEDMIKNVKNQIDRKQSEIDTLEYQIEQKKIEISFQKRTVLEYLKVIFEDQSKFSSMSEDGTELNTLKLLLSDDSTSENLRSLRYKEVLENQGKEIFEKLNVMVDEEETDQQILEVKKRTMQLLYNKLESEKAELDIQKKSKVSFLEQTKGDQKIYEEMLARTNAQQQDVIMEIETLHKNMLFVQEKIKILGSGFNPDDYTALLNVGNDKNLVNYLAGTTGDGGDFQPRWPISPARGISAFYHQASYYNVFHMQHNAIDIRTPQSTPIHSPADGYVYKARDNGYGYSYIMIAHEGGYMTLYGHVSNIMVSDGQAIKTGEVIGLSGATPGSKGAGAYTTGPHLHFEIFKNGEHVDPLDYMNLAYLRLDSLPEKYVAKALGDREKVPRLQTSKKVRNPNSGVIAEPMTE